MNLNKHLGKNDLFVNL